MKTLIRRYKEILLSLSAIVFAISFILILYSAHLVGGFNTILADSGFSNLTSTQKTIFIGAIAIFVLNSMFILMLLLASKSEESLIGKKPKKYTNNQKLVKGFIQAITKVGIKTTNNEYTHHLFKKLKTEKSKSYTTLKYITLKKKGKKLIVNVDAKINNLSNAEIADTMQLIVDSFSTSDDEEDPFKTMLLNTMDKELTTLIVQRGVVLD